MATPRYSLLILSCSLAFAGCATQSSTAPENGAQAQVDHEILEASRKIQFAQADLYQAGALNQETSKAPIAVSSDQQLVTVSWQGDALQLLAKLSRDRGIGLSVLGVRMPLPVNIDVRDAPYATVIEQLRAQIGYRAEISVQPDKLVLQYNRPQS